MPYKPYGDGNEAGDPSKLYPAVSTVPPPVTAEWQGENQDRQSLEFTKAPLQWEIHWLQSQVLVYSKNFNRIVKIYTFRILPVTLYM